MTAWLRTLGPIGFLLLAASVSVTLAALLAAIGVIAWVLSGESDTDGHEDEAPAGDSDDEPDPGGGELVALSRLPPSEPPPSDPRRAA